MVKTPCFRCKGHGSIPGQGTKIPPKSWCFWTVVLEKTLESPLDWKEIKTVSSKGNQPWIFIGRTDAEVPIFWPPDEKEPSHWKRPWCWERLRAGGEGDVRGWDGWMASPTQWTWVWANPGRWWRTGKPGMLQSMGLQSRTRLSDWPARHGQNKKHRQQKWLQPLTHTEFEGEDAAHT